MQILKHSKYQIIIFVLAILGFLDSLYFSIEHYRKVIPPCVTGFRCDIVTTSEYAYMFGIPVAYMGLVYYLLLFAFSILFFEKDENNVSSHKILRALQIISGIGFLASLRFTYIQAFVIEAWCLYCIFSALTTTLIFATTFLESKKTTGKFV